MVWKLKIKQRKSTKTWHKEGVMWAALESLNFKVKRHTKHYLSDLIGPEEHYENFFINESNLSKQ